LLTPGIDVVVAADDDDIIPIVAVAGDVTC